MPLQRTDESGALDPTRRPRNRATPTRLAGLSSALGAALLVALLAACAPTELTPPLPIATTGGLVGLNGDPLNLGVSSSCAVDAFDLPGQGFRHAGSVGGLSMDTTVTYGTVPAAFEPTYAAHFAGSAPANDSAIVVVDDYGNDVFVLGDEVFRQRASANPTPDALEATLEGLETANQLSHGAMTAGQINALIYGTGEFKPLSMAPDEVVWQSTSSGARLVVKAVNIDAANEDTAHIAALTADALLELEELHGVSRSVVNMSLVVLPCALVDDASASGLGSFESYMGALATLNRIDYDDLIAEVIKSVDDPNDPLFQLILAPNGRGEQHLYVASSGNYAMDQAMVPAAWDDVLAVTGSSFSDSGRRDVRLFNAGQVMQIGEWFLLERLEALYGPVVGAQDPMFLAGTSFSAPIVSVFSALDLMSASPRCASASGPSLLTDAEPTGDLWLDDAVAKYCP